MLHLEPTYLRYIYDGLIKGNIHPENAAELPDGLIGLYDEAFDDRTSVIERQKLLQRFAIWAILNKEVSAAFVAEILGETEDDIQEFISTYSAWFNSPESGKYQLYHERLKVYLLQKMSEGEIHELYEKLIARIERAIAEQKADEFEWYGLEYLAGHLGILALVNGNGKKLIKLAYSQAHWQRQLKVSKGFTWTKNGLKEVMTYASKYDDDEVIECGLQMVDLHHQEQNTAPQIVALVAEGDFDAALKRIEQFGGSDKEGLERKFILYMLCLMELTLLESKDKPFRKEGIEKLLKHLDEQLPVDHSVLDWERFFSTYLIFQVSCELKILSLDYLLIFKRTSKFNLSWLKTNVNYDERYLDILKEISSIYIKTSFYDYILSELSLGVSISGKINIAINYSMNIQNEERKIKSLIEIYDVTKNNGHLKIAEELLSSIINMASNYNENGYLKSRVFNIISVGVAKNGELNKLQDCLSKIGTEFWLNRTADEISKEMIKQDKVKELIELNLEYDFLGLIEFEIRELERQNERDKVDLRNLKYRLDLARRNNCIWETCHYFIKLSKLHFNNNENDTAKYILNELYDYFIIVENVEEGIYSLIISINEISMELYRQGFIAHSNELTHKAIELAKLEQYGDTKYGLFGQIFNLSKDSNMLILSFEVFLESICSTNKSYDDFEKRSLLQKIIPELVNEGKLKKALRCVKLLAQNEKGNDRDNDWMQDDLLIYVSISLSSLGQLNKAFKYIKNRSYQTVEWNDAIIKIAINYVSKGKPKKALNIVQIIKDKYLKCIALTKISIEINSKNMSISILKESFTLTNEIEDEYWKSSAISAISVALVQIGKISDGIRYANEITNEYWRSIALNKIFSILPVEDNNLFQLKSFENAYAVAKDIKNSYWKSSSLNVLSAELFKKGFIAESKSILEEALILALKIKNKSALTEISINQALLEDWEKAEKVSININSNSDRRFCWSNLIKTSLTQHGFEYTLSFFSKLQLKETKSFFISALLENISFREINKKTLNQMIFFSKDNPDLIAQIIRLQTIKKIFSRTDLKFERDTENSKMNIQWAIDLEMQSRLSVCRYFKKCLYIPFKKSSN